MYKIYGFIIISILLLFVLGACVNSKGNTVKNEDKSSGSSLETKVESEKMEENENKSGLEYKNAALVVEDAIFLGQVDANSIEVKTSNGVRTLQIGSVGKVNWSSIEVDTPIKIEYYENEFGQFELTNYLVK
ncbi:hypothetical protein [Pseudoneobacillus sp. C159]